MGQKSRQQAVSSHPGDDTTQCQIPGVNNHDEQAPSDGFPDTTGPLWNENEAMRRIVTEPMVQTLSSTNGPESSARLHSSCLRSTSG